MSDPQNPESPSQGRQPVAKTYKMFVGGQFVRSEGGKVLRQENSQGEFLANTVRASRKDLRDAVVGARKALGGWSGRGAFQRSQVMYRVCEVLESRRELFEQSLQRVAGMSREQAQQELDVAIDRWFWYSGWCDKFAQVSGSVNPVATPFFNFTLPEAVGVVALLPSARSPLAGLVSGLAPIVAVGNTAVVVVEQAPTLAVEFAEVIAASDFPGGVVQILTGQRKDLLETVGSHADVDAIQWFGSPGQESANLETLASDRVKRVHLHRDPEPEAWLEDSMQRLDWIDQCVEWKTAWHPRGI